MSDTLPVLPEPQPVDIQAPLGLPSASEWEAIQSMAEVLSRSGLVPAALRRKPDDIMLILLTGRDLRLQPTVALNKIHVIDGKPTCSAELMAALVNRQPGMRLWPDAGNSAERATARATRNGQEVEFTFTIQDAQRAGLAGKGTWAKFPQFMLWARAVSGLVRMAFPDVLVGVTYTPEEMGATVNPETGEVIDAVSRRSTPEPLRAQTLERMTQACQRSELTEEDIAGVTLLATDGRTGVLGELFEGDEVVRWREAKQALESQRANDDGAPF